MYPPRYHPYGAPPRIVGSPIAFPGLTPQFAAHPGGQGGYVARTLASPIPAQPVPSGVVVRPIAPNVKVAAPAKNPKALLNEWLTKNGHLAPYTTLASVGGFTATLVLPLEGAGDYGTATGTGPNKKLAETACAEKALEILASLDLLNSVQQTSKKPAKQREGTTAEDAQGMPVALGQSDFEELKQFILEKVIAHPGKRTGTYMMMCPAGERQKKVAAALYKLAEAGHIQNVPCLSGKKKTPFWIPCGYTGPLGGTVPSDELGEGRILPLTEEKMVCYDILASYPGSSAAEVQNHTRLMDLSFELKVINAALYSMKNEGTVVSVLDSSTGFNTIRWSLKEQGETPSPSQP